MGEAAKREMKAAIIDPRTQEWVKGIGSESTYIGVSGDDRNTHYESCLERVLHNFSL